jgi:hypothetical protein
VLWNGECSVEDGADLLRHAVPASWTSVFIRVLTLSSISRQARAVNSACGLTSPSGFWLSGGTAAASSRSAAAVIRSAGSSTCVRVITVAVQPARPDQIPSQRSCSGCRAREHSRDGWHPAFIDYLHLSFNGAMTLSPTGTSPIKPWAKLMMTAEEAISFVAGRLVVACAVNVLRERHSGCVPAHGYDRNQAPRTWNPLDSPCPRRDGLCASVSMCEAMSIYASALG